MKDAKVSVIIPVYNVEEYLVKCLESVINQTLQDIEIICINDGSTDNSYDILKNYAKSDKRIILVDKENEGQGIARNLGIQYARGEYISFVDPDDKIHPDMLKSMYEQANRLQSQIVICDYICQEEANNKAWKPNFFIKAVSAEMTEKIEVQSGINFDKNHILQTLLVSPCYSWNRLYNTKFLKSEYIKFSSSRCFEDVIFILKSHILADKISYVNTPLYLYSIRKSSTLRSLKEIPQILIQTFQEIQNYLQKMNLTEALAENFSYFVVMNTFWTCNKKYNKSEKIMLLNNAKKYICPDDYQLLKKKLNLGIKSPLQKIFSVKNKDQHKVLTFLGLKIKFRNLKGQAQIESLYIKKIKQNYKKYSNDSYILFDCLHDHTTECIDAYSLFLSMREQNLKAYYVLLKDTSLYRKLKAENKLENIIPLEYSSREFPGEFIKAIYEPLLQAKTVITSFGENSFKINKFFKDFPYWQYIFIQHGTIFMKESIMYNGYLYPNKFDKILICSEFEKRILTKYGWSDKKFINCGLPRWDLLNVNEPTAEKSIFIMFTWRELNILQFENSEYRKNILKFLKNPELHHLLQENNIKLYFAHHHALAKNNGINFKIETTSKNIQIIENTEISKYIKQASCLITDFSSVAFDFMFQNKPVIHYLLDAKDKILNEHERKDIERFEYKKFILPNVFYNEDDVLAKLKFYIANDFNIEPQNEVQYRKFFYTKNNIRQKLIKEIEAIK